MSELPITVADIVVLAVLLISAVIAFMRGFVHEMLSIGAWVGAAIGTAYAFPAVQPFARDLIAIDLLADIGAGVAIFIAILVVLAIVTRLLAKRVQNSALGALDRSLGLVFGVARGAVILAALWLVLVWALPEPDDRPDWIREAKSRRLVEAGGKVLASILPSSAKLPTSGGGQSPALGDSAPQSDYESLSQPAPKADAPERQSGYKEQSRKEMDRLFESQAGGSGSSDR